MLRVADEHAGKQARCPECGQISVVPIGVTIAPQDAAKATSTDDPRWSLRTPEGKIYGPISRTELDRWLAEGRIAADCQLQDATSQVWVGADTIYPQLRPTPVAPIMHVTTTPARAPVVAPVASAPRFQTYLAPHRGGIVLVLGILGFVMGCPIFSLMAWVMGSADLREMRAGRMDRSGEGITQVGHIFGALLSLLWIGGCVILALILIVAAAAGR